MWAGILNKKIYIYRSVNTRNDFGEEVEAYYEYSSTRAGVSHQSTSRTVINSEIQYPYTKFFVVRKYVDLTENDLIKFDGKYYRVLSIEDNDQLQNKRVDVERILEEVNIYTPPASTPTEPITPTEPNIPEEPEEDEPEQP